MSFLLGDNCSKIGGKEISRTFPLCKPSTLLFGVMPLVRFAVNKDAKDENIIENLKKTKLK